MTIEQPTSDFFTAGGTLPPDAPSYVKRPTDDELFRHIMAGEFCYVLTPRQMGKSSLMIRTAQRLSSAGVKSAIVDLTQIGTVDSEDQWYKGILTQIKRRLRLSIDPVAWWEERKDIPNIQKFIEFFEETLSEVKEHVVIFMDEIDTTLKLDFRDDFFAGIRAMFNARAENPDLKRVTFVLLGVASPSDLIKDRNRTPFNIGQEIPLRPFSREDARMLEKGLQETYPKFGQKILDRVFYWTNGHPYLTQKLCQSVVETRLKEYSDNEIDLLVINLFTSEEASRETNLQFVRDNVLSYPQRRVILSLYKKLLRGFEVPDNKNSLPQNHLKLSGLTRVEHDKLVVGNRIYSKVFDQKWVNRYTKVDWSYPIIIFLILAVISFTSVFINDGVRLPSQAATRENGIPVYKDHRSIQYLADLFQMNPIFLQADYKYKAKNAFFSLGNWDDQRNLMDISLDEKSQITSDDYAVVVGGLYTSLADVDSSEDTTELLGVMYNSLGILGLHDSDISVELKYWIQARNSTRNGKFREALTSYDAAITLNKENPATRFERARVHVKLEEYENALKDYEKVIAIAKESNSDPSDQTPIPSLLVTFSPSFTSTSTHTLTPTRTTTPTQVLAFMTTFLPASTLTGSVTNTPNPPTRTPIPSTPTLIPTLTSTPLPTYTATLIPIPTHDGNGIRPRFVIQSEVIAAVINDLEQNKKLSVVFRQSNPGDLPNLNSYMTIPTVTPLIPNTTPSSPVPPTALVIIPTTQPPPQCDSQYPPIQPEWVNDYKATGFITLKNLYTDKYGLIRDNLDLFALAYYNNRKALEENRYNMIDPQKLSIEKGWRVFLPPPSWIDEYRAFPIPILETPDQINANSTISISGSSALYPLSLQMSKCFNEATGLNDIQVESNGKLLDYCSGDIDIFASDEIGLQEIEQSGCTGIKFYKFEVARYAVTIIINEENPNANKIRDVPLTPDELQYLLISASSWNEVRSDFSNQPINRYYPGREGGTFNIVRNLLFPNRDVNLEIPSLFTDEDNYSIASKVVSDPDSIGLTGYGAYQLNKAKLRAIPINGISPNSDTLRGESPTYPLINPVFLYTGETSYNENPLLRYFISYYLAYEFDFLDELGYFYPSKDGFLNNSNTIP